MGQDGILQPVVNRPGLCAFHKWPTYESSPKLPNRPALCHSDTIRSRLHQRGALDTMKGMKSRAKPRNRTTSSTRQSVTIPPQLATAVRRVAKEKHLTMSRALVVLAQRGVEAETAARDNLKATYDRFMSEADPERKGKAGKDLVRAIFGQDALAEDPIL